MINIKRKAIIFGIKGSILTKAEKALLKEEKPWGVILFSRNIENISQLKKLITDIRNKMHDKKYPILIDQEGGRVARLKNPNWKSYPSAEFFGNKAEKNLLLAKKLVFKNSMSSFNVYFFGNSKGQATTFIEDILFRLKSSDIRTLKPRRLQLPADYFVATLQPLEVCVLIQVLSQLSW